MRKVLSLRAGAAAAMPEFNVHQSPPVDKSSPAAPPPAEESCDAVRCPWWPYSNATDFRANTALILAVLFCALICALALNAVVRYLVHRHCCRRRRREKVDESGGGEEKAAEVPAVVYAEGMELAGEERECIICLSEFTAGERIRVLERCSHGFHVQCIQRWLASRDSCPTCRAACSDELKSTPP
ncbi:RING/U-box superfamily protein [Striga asiatica]|uniref:RING-type E3 ubiquitin transferase n=1 Tax=Striga asiatica TaxID=4170 RepID=A0A5A7P027_STRAF|nr:RING/U-box superfamily protein [Striga asiatica]